MQSLFLPALISMLVPLLVTSFWLKGQSVVPPANSQLHSIGNATTAFERQLMFYLGLGILVAVPAFKSWTSLPPFMGILFGLGLLWLVGDMVHKEKPNDDKAHLTLGHALTRIDMASIIFFIGILLSVATLEHTHLLKDLAQWLDSTVGRQDVIVMIIGLVSAVVDNVPLVAASMGMYSLDQYPTDSFLWEFLAYCSGTGGSILIIGSAAGVAAMGLEKIDFIWYLKKISGLAFLGYVAGALAYIVQYQLTH
jgi:Na+/H+ antiporter NhaD/arsenite permease-like protein